MEEDIFVKALRFLYEKRLEQIGVEADIIITKKDDEKDDCAEDVSG